MHKLKTNHYICCMHNSNYSHPRMLVYYTGLCGNFKQYVYVMYRTIIVFIQQLVLLAVRGHN